MTLNKHLEKVNKEIAKRNNVKDGKANSFHEDIVSESKAHNLFKGWLPEALARHVSYIDRGNTFYISDAGLTLFMKRKRVSVPKNMGFGTYDTMYVNSIVVKEDEHNLADSDLMDIMDYAIEARDKKRREKEAESKDKLGAFNNLLEKHSMTIDDFLALRSAFNRLDHKDRISSEV